MDTLFSTHLWGNSKLTQFGITRLFETFLEVYIHSIHIKGPGGNFPSFPDLEFRIPDLWTCNHNAFFDAILGGC